MSCMIYSKVLTKGKVKASERHDVDLTALVKHGAHRIQAPTPVYPDLTDLPTNRGDAVKKIQSLTIGQDPELVRRLLTMSSDQALNYLSSIRPPATKRDDKNNANKAGSEAMPDSKPDPAAVTAATGATK